MEWTTDLFEDELWGALHEHMFTSAESEDQVDKLVRLLGLRRATPCSTRLAARDGSRSRWPNGDSKPSGSIAASHSWRRRVRGLPPKTWRSPGWKRT